MSFVVPSGDTILLLGVALGAALLLWTAIALRNVVRLLFVKGPFVLRPLIHKFEKTLNNAEQRLLKLPDSDVRKKPAEGKWSAKEILGHLIDSASNNHQRFVRAQLSSEITFPGYKQTAWVHAQDYQSEPWESLVLFWGSYNRHLMHVIAAIPSERLKGLCFVGTDEPVTLEFLVRDYIRHVNHHLEQIFAPPHI